jgi:hypothetical protein
MEDFPATLILQVKIRFRRDPLYVRKLISRPRSRVMRSRMALKQILRQHGIRVVTWVEEESKVP